MSKLHQLYRWMQRGQRPIWIGYSALSLAILLPLLLPGYILTLDLVFTPTYSWPQDITNTYPLEVLLWLLYWIFPGDVIEKIILFAILLFSGASMHLLVRSLRAPGGISAWSWRVAASFAGIFYMVNPFTYSRFMAGQWMVLLGYALLPFFVRQIVRCRSDPSVKSFIILALWMLAIVTVSLHHIGILLVLLAAVICMSVISKRTASQRRLRFIGGIGSSLAAVLLVSCFWLVPALLGNGIIGQSVAGFDETHVAAFATNGNGALGPVGEVIRLQGFWAETRNLYILPQALVPLWGLLFMGIWALVIMGAITTWRTHKEVTGAIVISIVVGVIFAATPFLTWLDSLIPLVGGYREPHKFANLIALGFALLGALGVAYVLRWAEKRRQRSQEIAAFVCLLLPIVVTPTMLWGFSGQLSPRSYPTEWMQMNERLKTMKNGETVLFLPWHQYASYGFSGGRIIANPAESFFEIPLLASDDPEYKNLPPTTPDTTKHKIAKLLQHPVGMSEKLRKLGVSHILLAKEQDWTNYDYLNTEEDVELVAENAKFKLYKVKEKS